MAVAFITNVIALWKTDRNVTPGLFHFIALVNSYPLIHYPCTVALPGQA